MLLFGYVCQVLTSTAETITLVVLLNPPKPKGHSTPACPLTPHCLHTTPAPLASFYTGLCCHHATRDGSVRSSRPRTWHDAHFSFSLPLVYSFCFIPVNKFF